MDTYAVGSTVPIHFTTNAAAGAAVAPSSAFEAADVILYKDTSATQRSSTSGWTMTSPFDAITGLHLLSIDLSDNTDAGFYAAGSVYTAVLSPDETIDSQTPITAIIGKFRIGPDPVNVTQVDGATLGTHASGLIGVDVRDIAGSAVSTASAQLGVNLVSYATGQDPATLVLATPANKIATNASGRVAIQSGITKNVAFPWAFLMVSSTDHTTPVTGLSVSAQRSLDGAAFGACANAVTELALGWYKLTLTTAEMNTGYTAVRATAAGADAREVFLVPQP